MSAVGVAVSPEEIAREIAERFPMSNLTRMLVANAVADALRAAEARGREEAAKIAESYHRVNLPAAYMHAEVIASSIRSLNAPQSPKSD